ncbi:hypothetical protein PC129_g19576 [Phytophthora cactorum]|uniref:Uncharacterized protein n=1 Tax=Phytophthora cactorum TaxID=29920 RepID=A0A329RI36_9STRA|nr:hypothetical protein Pcac1_g15253 [Phytophthora cactorum]KAG2833943.1 hypothetical protein PC113_g20485 [Phytophthora cactorum]KAG2879252.1 hypothetical protein PC114_g22663 [Phytophthora cactorum]KAG2916161.1 hypothetical protein PC117_g17818 [Phytophthora cactorum]KAG2976459.1 hypothetical protein PC119_g22187 [Phytophthora cactorum]
MIGDFTPSEVSQVRKMHRIRGQHVRDVFAFYKAYMSILPNEEALSSNNTYDDAENIFVVRVEDAGGTSSTGMNEEQENSVGSRRRGM